MKYNPWPYQRYTIDRIVDGTCGPLLDMGLGKTSAMLTGLDILIKKGEIVKPLIIAPLRIADEVWSTEVEKWDHLRHLKISKVLGSEKKRKAALLRKADIYVINRENVEWLVAHYTVNAFPFDCVVIDESSSFKDPRSNRFKALRKVAPGIKRKYILTGTPTPNGLMGIWSQVYFLDQGKRLGPSYSGFRDYYFEPNKRSKERIHSYKLRGENHDEILGADLYEMEIHEKIGDICFSMKASDYLDLPERIDVIRAVHFSEKTRAGYLKFERDQVLALANEIEVTALNAAALTNKLLQYANGAIYDADKNFHEVHNEKLDSLEELVEMAEGRPVLIFYSFRHDLERIKHRLRKYNPVHLKDSENIKAWNEGKIQVMLAHPASAGHGLNLQAGGDIIVWFGLPWSLELYQQANARLHRQGQTRPVTIYHMIVEGTMDMDVMAALEGKADTQESLMAAVKARIEKYTL